MTGRVRVQVDDLDCYDPECPPGVESATGNLVTSKVDDGSGLHMPVIDLDFPCELVASSTPGCFHLYLNMPVAWDACVLILDGLLNAGLIQPGWYDGCIRNGFMRVRHPDHPKTRPVYGPPAPEPEPW